MKRRQLLKAAAAIPLLPARSCSSSPRRGLRTGAQAKTFPASGLATPDGLPKKAGTSLGASWKGD